MNYCKIHQTQMEQRFSKTKFDDQGQPKPYFAHNTSDGKVCFGRPEKTQSGNTTKQTSKGQANTDMFICNAMNNATNLACHGVIGVDQIGQYFQKILTELNKSTEKKEDLDRWGQG